VGRSNYTYYLIISLFLGITIFFFVWSIDKYLSNERHSKKYEIKEEVEKIFKIITIIHVDANKNNIEVFR
jgi:hypothetical protein